MAQQKEYSKLVTFMVEAVKEVETYEEAEEIEEALDGLSIRRYKTERLRELYDKYMICFGKIKKGVSESKKDDVWKELKAIKNENEERLYLGDEEYEMREYGIEVGENSEGASLSEVESSPEVNLPSDVKEQEEFSLSDLVPHPLSEEYPLMSEEEYDGLKESIKEIGMIDHIILFEGKILDGRHRYQALVDLGKNVESTKFEEFKGTYEKAREYVDAKNKRRNLSKSQLAMIAALRVTSTHGDIGRVRKTRKIGLAEDHQITIDQAAFQVSIKRYLVEKALEVRRAESRLLCEAVKSGKVKIDLAAEIAKVPNEYHDELLALESPSDVRKRIEEILNPEQEITQSQEVTGMVNNQVATLDNEESQTPAPVPPPPPAPVQEKPKKSGGLSRLNFPSADRPSRLNSLVNTPADKKVENPVPAYTDEELMFKRALKEYFEYLVDSGKAFHEEFKKELRSYV